jgi:hypothetical protein
MLTPFRYTAANTVFAAKSKYLLSFYSGGVDEKASSSVRFFDAPGAMLLTWSTWTELNFGRASPFPGSASV